jgi:hypothetical protein
MPTITIPEYRTYYVTDEQYAKMQPTIRVKIPNPSDMTAAAAAAYGSGIPAIVPTNDPDVQKPSSDAGTRCRSRGR